MKISELVSLIGVYELVRIMNENYEEVYYALAIDIPKDLGELFIKSVYSHNSVINIIASLDKHKRKWYNVKENNAE